MLLQATEDAIDYAQGKFTVKNSPREVTLFEVAERATELARSMVGGREDVYAIRVRDRALNDALVNPGDVVLMTDPGYPAYRASIYMAGAEPYAMPMLAENDYFPDFGRIPPEIVKRARAMFLNYPNNPTGTCVDPRALEAFLAAVPRC